MSEGILSKAVPLPWTCSWVTDPSSLPLICCGSSTRDEAARPDPKGSRGCGRPVAQQGPFLVGKLQQGAHVQPGHFLWHCKSSAPHQHVGC